MSNSMDTSEPASDLNMEGNTNEEPKLTNKRSLEYTTENYKIEICNLPKHTKFHLVKNILENHYKLKPHKIKLGDRKAFVAFKSEQERDEAITKINGQDWKGRELVAEVAPPVNDVLYKKSCTNRDDLDLKDEPTEFSEDDINTKVASLWKKTYNEQIEIKDKIMRGVLDMRKELKKFCPRLYQDAPELDSWLQHNYKDKMICPFDGVIESEIRIGYRNKCEFNVGKDDTVGFKMGRYRNGSEQVVNVPKDCPLISETMFKILNKFQDFLRDRNQTKLRGFDRVTHEGNVRKLTVRTNQQKESLVIVDLHPQDFSSDDLASETDKMIHLFKTIEGLKSVYVNTCDKENIIDAKTTLKLVHGNQHLYEYLHIRDDSSPLKFCIGPCSFFQVNTKAAEVLYKSIIEFADLNENSLVLDMGCGTGTIALSLARQVSQVIGVEIVESAIDDAKLNAKENNIDNVLFFAGKAEDLIHETIAILKGKQAAQSTKGEIVAIVDPPRNGFNNSFIKALRASNIKKIIYVACDPEANTNLTTLCRPTSKAYQGDPFVPTRARAFDLFPHTRFCELVLVYQRLGLVWKPDSSKPE